MKANRYLYLLLLACVSHCVKVRAQATCPGSALAPVFKQTFGTSLLSTSKNAAPSGFITNYAYNSSGNLSDGQYMVTPLVQNAGKNDWAVGGDHTGDVNGNMFLVNAGTGASLFFKQQVNNLCPGSTFSFSAWLANVNTATVTGPICGSSIVYPNVTFYIKDVNGNVLASFNTGNVPLTANVNVAPNWQQYGFQFALPSGITSLVLEMVDAYGGQPQCGNDLAIDDIVFSACTPQASISINTTGAICEGSTIALKSSLLNSPFLTPAYQWQRSYDNGLTWADVGAPTTTVDSLILATVTMADNAVYRVLVGPDIASLSSSTCTTTSNFLQLNIHALPSAAIVSTPFCTGGTLNLSATVAGGVSPYAYSWSAPGFSSNAAQPSISNVTAAASYTLQVTDANGCQANAAGVIAPSPLPSPAVAGANQALCNVSSATLGATAPATGIGTWTQVSGPNTALIADPLLYNTGVSNLVPGTYTFRWTITSGACAAATNDVQITIHPATAAGTLAGGLTVCSSVNGGDLTLTGGTGNILRWESSGDNGITWNNITHTGSSLHYAALTETTVYRVLVQSGNCTSAYSNTQTVLVSQPTVAGILAGSVNVCATANSGNLSVSGYTGSIVQWETSADNGNSWSVVANSTSVMTFSNLATTTLYRVLIQNGPCVQLYTNTVTITVYQPVVAGTLTGDNVVCATANAGSLTLTGNIGTIEQWESSADNGNSWTVIPGGGAVMNYQNLSSTLSYRVLVSNGSCVSQYTNEARITVNDATVGGAVTGSASVCGTANNGTVTLAGYNGSIISWASSVDNGANWNILPGTAVSYSYSNLTTETLFKANVKNGVCPAAFSAQALIAVNPATVGGTVSGNATVCAGSNNGSLTLTGYTGSILQWEYSTDNGSTWSVIADTNDQYVYSNITGTTVYRALVQSGSCASQYSNNVTITVDQPTDPGTLSGAATVCASSNNGTITLTGNTGSIIHWEYSTDNGSSWNVITSTNNAFTFSNLTTTTLYRVLIQNGVCASQYSNNVTITVDQPTDPGTLSGAITVCASSNNGTITLTGNTGSIIHWEYSTDNGSSWNVIASTNNAFTFNNLATTTLYRVLVQNGICASQYSNNVTITVDQPTDPGTLSGATTVCASSNNGRITLTGNTGSIIHWEYSTDNGNSWNVIASTNNTLPFNNLATTTTYRVLIQNGVCASQYSNNVAITVDQPTDPGTLSGATTVCASSNNGSITLIGNTGSIIHWEYSIDNGSSWNVIASTNNTLPFNNLATTTLYRVLIQNGVCASQYSNNVIITVDQPTSAGTLSGATTVCASLNNGTITLTGNTGSITHWEYSTDNGNSWNVIASTNNTLPFNNLATTTLYRVLIQNGVCASQYSNNVIITVDQPTSAGTLSGATTVCASLNNGTITLTGNTGSITHWEYSTDNGNSWNVIASTNNTLPFNNLATTTLYRVLIQNGVCASQYSNNVIITVDQPTSAGTLSGATTVCASLNNGTITLTGNTGSIIHWEYSTDNGNSWNVIASTNNTLPFNNLATTTTYRALMQNGVCASQYSNNVIIIVDQPTDPGTLSGATTVCASSNNGTITLTGNTGSIIHWEYSTDNGSSWNVIASTNNAFTFSNLTTTTIYRSLIQNGFCASQYSNNVTIRVDQPTTAGTLSGATTVCASANNGTSILTGNTGSIIHWEYSIDNGSSWNVIASTNNAFTFNNLTTTTLYRVLIQNGVCASQYSNNIAVTVDQPTDPGTLSGATTVCASSNNGTITLTGNTGSIIHWEYSADNGSSWNVIASTNNAFTFSNLTTTTLYRVLIQNGVCASQYSNNVTITVDQSANPGLLSGNAIVCSQLNQGTVTLSGFNGIIAQWESSTDSGSNWSVRNLTQPTLSYTNLGSTTQFRVQVKNGVCPAGYSNIVSITTAPQVGSADAGADQFLCSTTRATLSANTPQTGSGKWTQVTGPSAVSFSNTAQPAALIDNLVPGTYQFEWRISNGVCADAKDTVVVVVYPPVINNIDTGTQVICKGQTIFLSAQPAAGGNNIYRYQWQESYDGNNWTDLPGANNDLLSLTPDTSVLLRRNVLSHTCVTTSKVVKVTLLQSISGNLITGNQQICQGAMAKEITGTEPAGGDGLFTYQWQQSIDSGAHWLLINEARSMHLSIASALTKTTWVRRIVTTQNCNGPLSGISNIVSIIVQPVATATVQYKGGSYCKLNTVIDFTAFANHTDSIRWNFGDGSAVTTTARSISHVYTRAGNFVPSAQFINTAGCNISVIPQDTLHVDEVKAAFTIKAVNDCGKTTYRFTDSSSSYFPVAERIWSINRNNRGNDSIMQYAFNAEGTNEAALVVKNAYGCEASLQAKFNVNIYSFPKVDINAVSEACLNNLMELKSVVNSIDSVKTRLWNLSNGMSATDSVVQVSFYSEGKYVVKLTVATINSCYDSAMKQINIHAIPKVSVNANNVVCKGGSIELKADGAAGYIWKDQSGNIVCNNCSTLKITPQKNTDYKVVGYSEYGCSEIASASVRVIQPFKLTAKAADTLCAGDSKKISVGGAASYNWRNDAGLSSYSSGTVVASPAVTTTYRVTGKDEFNCFTDTADIKLTVGKPTSVSIGSDTSVLSGVPVQLHAYASSPDIRSWQWKGNATFSCLSCATPTAKVIMDECLSCTATNIYGCKTTDTLCITTFCPGSEVFIPNAFTPDGDGINDILVVQGRGIKIIKSFRIFSRWGELVFERSNFAPGDRANGWDGRIRGKLASPDVFVYVCEAICEKGTPAVFKGNTAVLK